MLPPVHLMLHVEPVRHVRLEKPASQPVAVTLHVEPDSQFIATGRVEPPPNLYEHVLPAAHRRHEFHALQRGVFPQAEAVRGDVGMRLDERLQPAPHRFGARDVQARAQAVDFAQLRLGDVDDRARHGDP